jgi:anti-anti-sigma factor
VVSPDIETGAADLVVIGQGLWARVAPGVMTFHGDIDLVTERQFRCAVTAQARRQGGSLTIDFTALNFLDSGGIGALYAMANDPELTLSLRVSAGSIIDRVLGYSGMDRILKIERIQPGVPPNSAVA